MKLETYSDEKLKHTQKKMKAVLITIALIWAVLIVSYLVFIIFFAEPGSFRMITAIPFFIGPVTLLPLYLSYKKIVDETRKRQLV